MMVDVDDEAAVEPGNAGAREVAGLHHDHRIAGVVDARGDVDVGDAGDLRAAGNGVMLDVRPSPIQVPRAPQGWR